MFQRTKKTDLEAHHCLQKSCEEILLSIHLRENGVSKSDSHYREAERFLEKAATNMGYRLVKN